MPIKPGRRLWCARETMPQSRVTSHSAGILAGCSRFSINPFGQPLESWKMNIELTLMSRGYCHLCHDMEAALAPIAEAFQARVTVLDVDADPALEAKYDERVPVLLHGETELCHYFLDAPRVQSYLESLK